MNNAFYTVVSVKDSDVHVSKPYKWNYSLPQLCDYARSLSIENENVVVSIYKHYLETPSNTRLLYRFFNGQLVRF